MISMINIAPFHSAGDRTLWPSPGSCRWRVWSVLLLVGGTLVSSDGCGSDTVGLSPQVATGGYQTLTLNQHAITMSVSAPYNTIQLQATPVSAAGMPILNAGAVQYRVVGGDTSITVSTTGLVTAKAPTYHEFFSYPTIDPSTPVSGVIASLTVRGTTLKDTAYILVTATAPGVPLASVSIQPPAESLGVYQSGAWLIAGDGPSPQLPLTQRNASGVLIDNPVVYVTTSDVNTAYVNGGTAHLTVHGTKPGGTVTFALQTWYYGVARSDSLTVKVGYPSVAALRAYERTPFASLTPQLYWYPTNIAISAPGYVAFLNLSPDIAIDAMFDDPTHVQEDTADKNGDSLYHAMTGYPYFPQLYGRGNVAAFKNDTAGSGAACTAARYDGTTPAADSMCAYTQRVSTRYRFFTVPGTYTYHTVFGNGGKIVVH